MRSRYAAYVLGDREHIVRTWHPRTRPQRTPIDDTEWSGLKVLRIEAGGPSDDHGVVEFVATWSGPDGPGRLHEVSHFTRRAGRWFYLEGDTA